MDKIIIAIAIAAFPIIMGVFMGGQAMLASMITFAFMGTLVLVAKNYENI